MHFCLFSSIWLSNGLSKLDWFFFFLIYTYLNQYVDVSDDKNYYSDNAFHFAASNLSFLGFIERISRLLVPSVMYYHAIHCQNHNTLPRAGTKIMLMGKEGGG